MIKKCLYVIYHTTLKWIERESANNLFYKITKIVSTLERRGCMRVCKHGSVT